MRIITFPQHKTDLLGAISSGLCMIHCLATPFIFVVQACSVSCCAASPFWWRMLDYFFLGISLFAIFHVTKNTSKHWIKTALWVSWTSLLLLILNESFVLISLPKGIVYLPALSLIGLHIYNYKYCQCSETACCVAKTI